MTPRELLLSGAEELGTPLTVEQVNSVFLFLAELKKWNRRINLTAIKNERDIIIKHVLDSLSFAKGFSPASDSTLLDMGSGAGFPAIPLKIAFPDLNVTLVESVKKKTAFLRHIERKLALTGIEIAAERVEKLPATYDGRFHVVTARAFADIEKALETGERFLLPHGRLVLSRGPEETIDERMPVRFRLVLKERTALILPHSDHRRVIWMFMRTG